MLLKVLATAGLVLVVLPAAYLGFEHIQGHRRLERTLARLAAAGERVDIATIAPPPVPASSNGIDRLLAASTRLGSPTVNRPSAMLGIAPGVAATSPKLETWGSFSPRRSNNWASVAAWVESSEAALDDVRSALAMPFCQYSPEYARSFNMLLPHLASIKSAATGLSCSAALATRGGDFDAALADLRSMGQAADALRREPIMISQLVRVAISAITLQCAWDILHGMDLSDEQLVALRDALPAKDLLPSMATALEGERAVGLLGLRGMNASGLHGLFESTVFDAGAVGGPGAPDLALPTNLDEAANLASGMASGLAQAVRRHFVMPLWRFAFQEHAIATYLEDMQAVLDRARALVETRRLLQDGSSLDSPPFLAPPTGFADWGKKLISSTTIPALEKAMSKAFVGMVQRSLLETDIALSRFRKRHGRYPESLERLVPEFLPELPVDAIDGKPLRYRLDPNRPDPLLWSVGENGTDEGGDPTPRAEGLTVNHHWWRGKDAVWPRPATSEEIAEWHSREQNTRGRIMGSKASSGSSNAFVMSPELMRRYGLIPASPPSPPPTNSPRGPTTR